MPDDVHERASKLFTPDALLPSQYFDRIRRRKDLTGEERLMIAVIEQAVDDYLKYVAPTDRVPSSAFSDAERWIESTDRSWLYAFETICDYMGLDAECFRKGLRHRKARARGLVPAVQAADVAPQERRRASNE